MTIAYNSAYIETETLNSTQAIIVYFDVERWILMLAYWPIMSDYI